MTGADQNDVLLTLGNGLRGDDNAGIFFAGLITDVPGVTIINGGDAPENRMGEIEKLAPDRIIIVDALDFGGRAGEWTIVPSDYFDGAGVSTHGSFGLMISYLKLVCMAEIYLVGIQPGNTGLGAKMSAAVVNGVKRLAETIQSDGTVNGILEDERFHFVPGYAHAGYNDTGENL